MLIDIVRAAVAVTVLALAGGCAAVSSERGDTMRVSVNGVNYSGDVVVFSVEDPAEPKSQTGGDRMSAYSGSGIQCCVVLPKVWRPGLTLQINAIIYPVDESDFKRELPRYMKKFAVEVPQYSAESSTELWVVRTAEGDMRIVASRVAPSDAAWPGLIKGWPEPSLKYKLRNWEIHVSETKGAIERTKKAMEKGMSSPESRLAAWAVRKENRPSEIAQFSGPEDPAFAESIMKQRAQLLVYLEAELKRLMENKP